MKIAVMQPYFLPNIGYFELLNNVDIFVLYDDCNYINKGWIDRNFININGSKIYFKIPLNSRSQNKHIKDIFLTDDNSWKIKLSKSCNHHFSNVEDYFIKYELLKKNLYFPSNNLVFFIKNSIEIICDYLSIDTKIILSSSLKLQPSLKGQNKIIAICKYLGFDHYINPIGGKNLYDKNLFNQNNIKLSFHESLLKDNYEFYYCSILQSIFLKEKKFLLDMFR
tara:strand:- start:1785 stop:2453 length:669 start_codon:yes stop_codon:yes gene_type:complete